MGRRDIVKHSRWHRALGGRAEQAGLYVAAATLPATFQRTLMPRTTMDQGVVTGLSTALNAGITGLVQEAIEVLALGIGGPEASERDPLLWRRTTLAVDLAAIGFGFAIQGQYRQTPDERLFPATAMRTLGYWLSVGGFAGAAVGSVDEMLDLADVRLGMDGRLAKIPPAIPAGLLIATVSEIMWRVREAKDPETGGVLPERFDVAATKAVATGIGIYGGLVGLGVVQRIVAGAMRLAGRRFLPEVPGPVFTFAGHVVAFGLLAGALVIAVDVVERRLEKAESVLEPAFREATSPKVSGGPGSLVSFDTLGKWGRRHVGTVLDRGDISAVMDESSVTDPIRVFIGLDSAATEEARVALAIEELERTGAFDRSRICVISPTGTGYVNYVFADAFEYLSRGDCAMVSIQYSKRPSVLSLDRVWQGRRHFRLLLDAVHDRILSRPPGRRPAVLVFGESLGAQTSQDGFLHQGTKGLQNLGVERALWIGTPFASKWKEQVLRDDGPDIDGRLIGVFDDIHQLQMLDPHVRGAIRYYMVTHDNDAVTKFGLPLLLQAPEWLAHPASGRPAKVPRSQHWSTPVTFVQTLIDMKNAMDVAPGRFAARGHDYRADLAAFVKEAYALPATAEQMERLEAALRRNELRRAVQFGETADETEAADDAEAAGMAAPRPGGDGASAGSADDAAAAALT